MLPQFVAGQLPQSFSEVSRFALRLSRPEREFFKEVKKLLVSPLLGESQMTSAFESATLLTRTSDDFIARYS